MMDMVRINHGLQPKHNSKLPPSGMALMSAKLGVVEQNKKRQILFKEREQQLFEVIKKLWNAHHDGEKGAELFSEDAELEVHYVEPEFAIDPQTRAATIKMEQELLNTGSYESIKAMKPHLDDYAVKELIRKSHQERIEQAKRDAEIEAAKINKARELGVVITDDPQYRVSTSSPNPDQDKKSQSDQPRDKINNRVKHSEQSSIQPGKNGDHRKSDKTKRAEKQQRKESGAKEE